MTPTEALVAARKAVENRRFFISDHAALRSGQRKITVFDMKHVVHTATDCTPYPDGIPRAGGTCWRLSGTDLDGDDATLGIELVHDHLGNCAVVITVF